ncbi:hypothetical protein JOC25_002127 [Solibacillus kalamii]|nr:hypothetical protein [Solibacillus kalamii]
MRKIILSTDSGADLPKELVEKYQIQLVRITKERIFQWIRSFVLNYKLIVMIYAGKGIFLELALCHHR